MMERVSAAKPDLANNKVLLKQRNLTQEETKEQKTTTLCRCFLKRTESDLGYPVA